MVVGAVGHVPSANKLWCPATDSVSEEVVVYRFCLLFLSEITLTDLCCLLYQDNIVMQFHSSILSVFAVVGSLVGHVHANTNIFINDAVAHDDVQLDTPSFTTLHGHSHSGDSHCGTYQPSPEEMAIQEAKFISLLKAKAKGNVASSFAARDKIDINVHFHVIMNSTATGNLTDTQITDQMSVLNNGFANTKIELCLSTTPKMTRGQIRQNQ